MSTEDIDAGGRFRLAGPLPDRGPDTWLATRCSDGRDVVVRRVPQGGGEIQQRRVDWLAGPPHPHVIGVLEQLTVAGADWLVTEHVPGHTLATCLKEWGPLAEQRAAALGRDLADGLAAAHRDGVVWECLDAATVLLCDDGIARLDLRPHRLGDPVGESTRRVPELVHGRAASATSDVFLLGSVVYLAVEGHGPFDSPGDPAELVRLVGSGTTRETERARGLVGVLSRLHAPDPAARPSAAEAATLLGSVSARAAATVVAEPPPPTAPGPTRADGPTLVPAPEPAPQGVAPPGPRRWVRRGTAAVTATLLLLTGAAIAAAVVLRPSQGATTAPERRAIGDARLADPCALVRPGSLARFGEARTVTDFSSYESCSIDLREPAASSPTVRVVSRFLDPAGDPDPTRTAPAPRPEITRPPAAANGACRRGLTLPDRYDVEFSAVVIESTTTGLDLCAVADAALTDALLTLLGHGVPLRATAPAGGLAELDACALVGPAAGEVPDLAGLPTDPGFGGWSCVVGRGGAAGPSASIRFSRSFAGNDSPTAVVGGRPAAVTPGTGRCALRMVGRSYTGAEGDDLVELVLLDVEGTTDPCATAAALATAMAPAVPA